MENYQILANDFLSYDSVLGEGNSVIRAIHRPTDTHVALKVIELRNGSEFSLALLRESLLMWELDHENIIRPRSIFVHDGSLYIAMECMPYDLRFHMAVHEKRYPEIAKDFLKNMLSAVAYCHSHGVLHRDLKPENILVDVTNGRVKLADFGTARGFLNADKMLTLTPEVTTLVYRAPELLQNPRLYSTASDVWALGCIFAEMLRGGGEKVLFEGDNQMEVLSEIKRIIGNGDAEISTAAIMDGCGVMFL